MPTDATALASTALLAAPPGALEFKDSIKGAGCEGCFSSVATIRERGRRWDYAAETMSKGKELFVDETSWNLSDWALGQVRG